MTSLEDFEILDRKEIEGQGSDAIVRRRSDGARFRLWAGGRAAEKGELSPAEHAQRLGKIYQSGLPRILEGFVSEERAVFLVELYEGETLGERMRRGPIEIVEALDIVKSIGAALAKGHAGGVIHGHIDEQAIFLQKDGRPLLLYLGMGPYLLPRSPRAPEELLGTPTETSDVFGLARVLFLLATGRDPYEAEGADTDAAARIDASQLSTDLPEGLRRFLVRSIHPDVSMRIRRAEEFAGDLRVLRASWNEMRRSPQKALPFPRFSRAFIAVIMGAITFAALQLLRGCGAGS
jgi:serine/threonine protein kinase